MGVKGVIARYARWGIKDDSFGCCLPMVLSLTPLTPLTPS